MPFYIVRKSSLLNNQTKTIVHHSRQFTIQHVIFDKTSIFLQWRTASQGDILHNPVGKFLLRYFKPASGFMIVLCR